MKNFSVIGAADLKGGIGKSGTLPWHLPGDMEQFKQVTVTTSSEEKQNAAIMGRKTWESLPEKFRPLAGRLNAVLTRHGDLNVPEGVLKFSSLEDALNVLQGPAHKDKIETVFVIGGSEVFKEALAHPRCEKIYLTHILFDFNCDVFFPAFEERFGEVLSSSHFREGAIEYYFAVYSDLLSPSC